MAPFLRQPTSLTAFRLCVINHVFKWAGLGWLVLVTLSSCNRATYLLRSSQHAYAATERRALSASVSEALPVVAPADAVPTASAQHAYLPARRSTKKRWPSVAKYSGRRPTWARPLATKIVAQHLAKMAATPHSPRTTARYESTASSSATLIVALCLLGAGLLGLLIGASMSTSIAGAIFGLFFIVLGSLAIAAGLVTLIVALAIRK